MVIAPAPTTLTPGQTIGGYVVERLLGRGGMGEVWRARDKALLRDVALKVLSVASNAESGTRARFVAEGRAAAALVHPNVVTVFGAGEEGGVAWIAMELLEGATLRTAMREASTGDRLGWLLALARALEAVHERGLVHRDVKPDNVFVTRSGTLKLLDFGIARGAPRATSDDPRLASQTATGHIVGTPRYLAPEQWRGGSVDARTDQFAWGIVAYEVLSGRHPDETSAGFGRLSDWTASAEPLHTVAPALPFGVSPIVMRALAVYPHDRFPATSALAAELEAAITRQRAEDARPTIDERPTTERRRGGAGVFLGALLAVPLFTGVALAVLTLVPGAPLHGALTKTAAAPASAAQAAEPPPIATPATTEPATAAAETVPLPLETTPDAAVVTMGRAKPQPTPVTTATGCHRFRTAFIDASALKGVTDPGRDAWEKASSAPVLACVQAHVLPKTCDEGDRFRVTVWLNRNAEGSHVGVAVQSVLLDGKRVLADAQEARLQMCLADALDRQVPVPRDSLSTVVTLNVTLR